MKTETMVKIVCRIATRALVFGIVGAILCGPIWALCFGQWLQHTHKSFFSPETLGFWSGAIQMGAVGAITAKRRDWGETLQMAIGGALGMAMLAVMHGAITMFFVSWVTRSALNYLFLSVSSILGLLIGTLYFALHPKYAPREEALVIFSDDYLKDEKIEWK